MTIASRIADILSAEERLDAAHREIDSLHAELTVANAWRDAQADALRDLVRYVRRVDGYMTHEDQMMVKRCEEMAKQGSGK